MTPAEVVWPVAVLAGLAVPAIRGIREVRRGGANADIDLYVGGVVGAIAILLSALASLGALWVIDHIAVAVR